LRDKGCAGIVADRADDAAAPFGENELVSFSCRFKIGADSRKFYRIALLAGGQVTLEYASYILTGATISASNLIETNIKEVATAANWKLSDSTIFQPVTLTLDKTLVEGLRMGLHGVQPGDEAYILFTGEFAFGNKENGTIPAKSALVYHVLIESIKNE
jgi:hypothetical protein